MTLSIVNKTVYQGADDLLSFTITDVGGVARDIFGATFVWVAYHNLTGDVLQKQIGNGVTIDDHATGAVTVAFTAAEMTLAALTYTYQLEMTITSAGVTTTTLEAWGYLQVEPGRIIEEVMS